MKMWEDGNAGNFKCCKKRAGKAGKKGREKSRLLKFSAIDGGCSAKVFIEQVKKEKGDRVIYTGGPKIYAAFNSYDEVKAAEVDFKSGGFEVKSRFINNG